MSQLAALQERVEQYDAIGAAAVLHAIKGSSGSMGARALSQLAGDLEQQMLHEDESDAKSLLANGSLVETLHKLLLASDKILRAAFELPESP